MKRKIYIADDDDDIRNLVKIFLESEKYEVLDFSTGDELYNKFLEESSDLVILDIMMPGTDGLNICKKIRQISDVPIILLTAKDSDADYVAGITLGSDDYIVKPFRPTILNMKIKALFRRLEMNSKNYDKSHEEIICGNIRYSKSIRSIFIDDKEINFTRTEMNCLKYFMEKKNTAISREDLLEKIWGYDSYVETRVTDETVRKLRKKLKNHGSNQIIKNKWGFGYIMVDEE